MAIDDTKIRQIMARDLPHYELAEEPAAELAEAAGDSSPVDSRAGSADSWKAILASPKQAAKQRSTGELLKVFSKRKL